MDIFLITVERFQFVCLFGKSSVKFKVTYGVNPPPRKKLYTNITIKLIYIISLVHLVMPRPVVINFFSNDADIFALVSLINNSLQLLQDALHTYIFKFVWYVWQDVDKYKYILSNHQPFCFKIPICYLKLLPINIMNINFKMFIRIVYYKDRYVCCFYIYA